MTEARSIEIARSGGPGVMKVRRGPVPVPGPGQVLIDVAYAGVNFADVVMRQGFYEAAPKPPFVPGFEVAGTVTAIGEGVDEIRLQDRVLGVTKFGGYTSHLCLGAAQVRAVPEGIGLAQAAALPAVYGTAWIALQDIARVRPGETLLCHAIAGGVGTAALQIGKHLGLRVIGTASTDDKLAFAKGQGLDVGINYAREDFLPRVMSETGGLGVDVCLDSVGGRVLDRSFRSLAPGGRLVLVGAADLWPSSPLGWLRAGYEAVTMRRFTVSELVRENRSVGGLQLLRLWDRLGDRGGALDELVRLLGTGVVRPVIDREFPLEAAGDAHEYLEARRTKGKVVLRVAG